MASSAVKLSCGQEGRIKGLFNTAIRKAFPSLQVDAKITPANPKFGDYQCNNAMKIFGEYGDKETGGVLGADCGKNVMSVANRIREYLPAESENMFESVTVTGGFITVKIAQSWLNRQVRLKLAHLVYHMHIYGWVRTETNAPCGRDAAFPGPCKRTLPR